MRYQVSGKQIDIGEALRTHVEEELSAIIEKYAQRPTNAQIIFSRNAAEFVCETTLHLSTGLNAQARASAHEIYAAFEKCADKMEKQLRRYKRRLKDHHNARQQPIEQLPASSYILASSEEPEGDEAETLQPMIIAEMETSIPSVSVGEAVMQMELTGVPALVFRNESSKAINVVYRREDGNIGWVDPANVE